MKNLFGSDSSSYMLRCARWPAIAVIMKQCCIPIALFVLISSVSVSAQQETILVIESYHNTYLWDASYKEGIKEIIGDRYNLVSFEMDTLTHVLKKILERIDYEIF